MSEKAMSLMDFVQAARSQIKELNGEELTRLRADNPDVLLVDVRESSEHEQGHIEGAMLVPRGILEAAADHNYPKRFQALVDARERPVVLYCATGGRSAMAAVTLQLMGFQDVASLAGGFTQWEKDGLPVVREARYV